MKIGAVMFFTSNSMQPAEQAIELEQRQGCKSLWVPEHTHIPLTRRTSPPSGGPLIRPYFEDLRSVRRAQHRRGSDEKT